MPVWDCATGTGQTAAGLAGYFERVYATDASFSQLKNAVRCENIHYCLCLAEKTCLSASSINLVTVSQAIHWFDFDAFFREVARVLVDEGILAFWCYGLCSITPEIDEVVGFFYHSVVGSYWPKERRYIEENYRNIPMPFSVIEAPSLAMRACWNFESFLGYLTTWSAVQLYGKEKAADPVEFIREGLLRVWGDPERKREIVWPLSTRAGRKMAIRCQGG